MHYVVSDIHGHMDKFLTLLDTIHFRKWDRMYILGDVIDRGPDGVKLLEYIMQQNNMIFLKGNHEHYMCKAIVMKTPASTDATIGWFENWFANGGKETYRQLLQKDKAAAYRIVDFADEQKSYGFIRVKGKEYLLVHAGLFWNPDLSFEKNLEFNEKTEAIYEIRNGYLDREVYVPFTIISGHTPTCYLPEYIPDLSEEETNRCYHHKILIRKNRIFIDCGCGNGHNLGCLRLEDGKEFYV